MIVFIMLGVSGCMDRHEKNNEEMLAHMKEKYGVEFEIQNYIPRNVDCSYDVWFCNAVGDDPEQDRIEVHRYYGDLAKDGEAVDYYTSDYSSEEERTEHLRQVGQEIEAKIVDLDVDSHKISLSMKALSEPERKEDLDVADVDIEAVGKAEAERVDEE